MRAAFCVFVGINLTFVDFSIDIKRSFVYNNTLGKCLNFLCRALLGALGEKYMKCPYCKAEDTKVVDSRPTEDGESIRRRRVCRVCSAKFSTFEYIEQMPIMVIKKDKSRQIFDRNKLLGGLLNACHKRPVTSSQLEFIVKDIENAINQMTKTEIPSQVIGKMVMDRLKDIDEVAYVRFASVYREFKDVDTFLAELEDMKSNKNAGNET